MRVSHGASIPRHGAYAVQVKALGVFAQTLQALQRPVGRYDHSAIVHLFGYLRGLASGRAARIQHVFTRLGIEQVNGHSGAGILDLKVTVGIGWRTKGRARLQRAQIAAGTLLELELAA